MTFLPYAKCLRLRKLQIWSPIIAKGTVDLAVGWALLNLKQHLTKHTEEKMEIHKVKSAHHATHKNVGFGCSTNAKPHKHYQYRADDFISQRRII